MISRSLLGLAFVLFWLRAATAEAVVYAHVVMDAATGRVLQAHNADTLTPPASLTKMMTLYMIFEALQQGKLKLSSKITITPHGARQIPTKLGVKPGTQITVEQAILALLTRSANDVSASYAEHVAKTESAFAHQMTQKARTLGLQHTIFKNASGVPAKGQLTTAREMAKLSRILFQHFPTYTRYFATKVFHYRGQPIHNHNHMLGPLPQDESIIVDGIKTGFVNASGFNLAASAIKRGQRLFAVVMGGPSWRWRDQRMGKLLQASYRMMERGQTTFAQAHDFEEDIAEPVQAKPALTRAVAYDVPHQKPNKNPPTWAVQLGTYRTSALAQQAAKASLRHLAQSGHNARIAITPTGRKTKRQFRARLAGLDRASAQRICQKLSHQGQRCLAMRNVSPRLASAGAP
ncbi:MAG: serine hydrolase [Holosporales bacterium]